MIVDTPPSRHAIDLLEAPDRLIGFLSHPVYRALTIGQRTFAKVTNAAASMFLWAVRRLAGPQIVEDTMEFFRSLANIEPGLRRRAERGVDAAAIGRRDVRRGVEPAGRGDRRSRAPGRCAARRGASRSAASSINLIHPLPAELDDADRWSISSPARSPITSPGTTTSAASRSPNEHELAALVELAGDAPVVELALRAVDVHDVEG